MSIPRLLPGRGRSQSLVEFALVVPLFLVLLFALIDFGRLEFSYVALVNAAREMARSAAIPATCTPSGTPCYTATAPSPAQITASSVAVDQSFKNYESFILSDLTSSTNNTVTVIVTDKTCLALLAAGNGPCVFPDAPTKTTVNGVAGPCTLPLDGNPAHAATYCAVPTRYNLAGGPIDVMPGGSVDVVASIEFTFNPVFQNRLTGMVGATFFQKIATLTTTARAYIE